MNTLNPVNGPDIGTPIERHVNLGPLADTGYCFPETYQFAHSFIEDWKLDIRVFNPAITAARQKALYGNLWEQGEEGNKKYALLTSVAILFSKTGLKKVSNAKQRKSWGNFFSTFYCLVGTIVVKIVVFLS